MACLLRRFRAGLAAVFFVGVPAHADPGSATPEGTLTHDTVEGGGIDVMDVIGPGGKTESTAFVDLGKARAPGTYTLHVALTGQEVRIPHCNGRASVSVDGLVRDKGGKGPLILQ